MEAVGRVPETCVSEALRLAAIVGISLFHTMMPWTAQALCDPQAGCGPIGEALGSDPVMLTVLGVISLMGAWGNHVFFMISGLYLVPSLARRSTQVGLVRLGGGAVHGVVGGRHPGVLYRAVGVRLGGDGRRYPGDAGVRGLRRWRLGAARRRRGGFRGVCGCGDGGGWPDQASAAAMDAAGLMRTFACRVRPTRVMMPPCPIS